MIDTRLRQLIAPVALGVFVCWCAASERTPIDTNVRVPRDVSVGDVAFFSTVSWRGRIVRLLQSRGDDFTHAGVIVSVTGDRIAMAHAMPTDVRSVTVQDLEEVLRRPEVVSLAIYRPKAGPDVASRAADIARRYASKRVPFDDSFDLTNDRAVYCTELIWLSYRRFGLKLTPRGRIVYPSDLLRSNFFVRLEEGP